MLWRVDPAPMKVAGTCAGLESAGLLAYTGGPSRAHFARACSADTPSLQEDLLAKALSNVSGFPRIGAQRELKLATEAYWAGSARATSCSRPRAPARRELEAPARRRDRPDPVERLLVLRPGARHDRAGRRGARSATAGTARATSTSTPTSRWRAAARRRRRRDRDGDDEVVRHQLPLHRPRARARHEVQAVLAQAVRPVPGGEGARDRDQAGPDRPAHASCSRASAPARSSTGSSCSTRSSRCTRRCSRSSAGSAPSGSRSTSRCWSRTARPPSSRRSSAPTSGSARSRARPRSSSTPTSTTSARPSPCWRGCRSRAIGLDFVRGEQNRELVSRARLARGQDALRRRRLRPQRLDQRPRPQPRVAP